MVIGDHDLRIRLRHEPRIGRKRRGDGKLTYIQTRGVSLILDLVCGDRVRAGRRVNDRVRSPSRGSPESFLNAIDFRRAMRIPKSGCVLPWTQPDGFKS